MQLLWLRKSYKRMLPDTPYVQPKVFLKLQSSYKADKNNFFVRTHNHLQIERHLVGIHLFSDRQKVQKKKRYYVHDSNSSKCPRQLAACSLQQQQPVSLFSFSLKPTMTRYVRMSMCSLHHPKLSIRAFYPARQAAASQHDDSDSQCVLSINQKETELSGDRNLF